MSTNTSQLMTVEGNELDEACQEGLCMQTSCIQVSYRNPANFWLLYLQTCSTKDQEFQQWTMESPPPYLGTLLTQSIVCLTTSLLLSLLPHLANFKLKHP